MVKEIIECCFNWILPPFGVEEMANLTCSSQIGIEGQAITF